MLNLVQVQERLKDMPMQALMQYANGMNPQVPPFIALGELNRRKQMQQAAAAEQAKQMEGAPTVKEQIEQQAGLMALQGQRQRSAMQQAASQQAQMPMPATNTMQSEPVQLASGGAVDPVGYRDYMGGGIARLPMRRDMFERRDYAGGGIVAFNGESSSYVDTSQTMQKKGDQWRKMLEMLFGKSKDEVDPADTRDMMKVAATGESARADENYGNEGRNYPQGSRREFYAGDKPREAEGGLPSIFQPRQAGSARPSGAVAKALGLKPEDIFPVKEPRKFEDVLAEKRDRERSMGISEGFMDEREKRLANIEAQRAARRSEEPMEQLTAFLSGIAEGRGGNWATQGARGAKASAALRAQQAALREKQDMEMDELRYTMAAKRDAMRRGDMKEVEALTAKEEDLKRDMLKGRADMAMRQGQLETSSRQADANIMQAMRPTDFERQKELYAQHARETGERPTAAGFQRFMLGTKASTVMTMEDAIRIAASTLGPGASMQEIQQRATELLRLGGGSAAGANAPKTVDFSQLPKR